MSSSMTRLTSRTDTPATTAASVGFRSVVEPGMGASQYIFRSSGIYTLRIPPFNPAKRVPILHSVGAWSWKDAATSDNEGERSDEIPRNRPLPLAVADLLVAIEGADRRLQPE